MKARLERDTMRLLYPLASASLAISEDILVDYAEQTTIPHLSVTLAFRVSFHL